MGPEAIVLSVRQNGREGTYRFTCPVCFDDVEKRADRKIVALLVSAGVDVTGAGPGPSPAASLFDAEGEDRRERDQAPPFTVDDLIDFHFRLQDDRYIQEFLSKQ